jgi:hypothetical protein
MAAGKFADNPNYSEFERLLIRLNDLMAEGQGDSEEADALREGMFDLRRGLSPEEEARLDGLSADLYMLQDDEVFEGADPAERTRESLGGEIRDAWRAEDWPRVLSLLRKGPDFLTRAELARARAFCYARLGHADAAILFAECAARLNPADAGAIPLALSILALHGRADEAAEMAKIYLNQQQFALAPA